MPKLLRGFWWSLGLAAVAVMLSIGLIPLAPTIAPVCWLSRLIAVILLLICGASGVSFFGLIRSALATDPPKLAGDRPGVVR